MAFVAIGLRLMSKEMIMIFLFTLNPNRNPNHNLQCFVFQEFSLEARQTTWRCSKKTKKGLCTGAIRVGENFLVAKIHNHPGDHKKVTELKIRSKVIYSSTIMQGRYKQQKITRTGTIHN